MPEHWIFGGEDRTYDGQQEAEHDRLSADYERRIQHDPSGFAEQGFAAGYDQGWNDAREGRPYGHTPAFGRPCSTCEGGKYVCAHGSAAECEAGYPHGSRLCGACEGRGVLFGSKGGSGV